MFLIDVVGSFPADGMLGDQGRSLHQEVTSPADRAAAGLMSAEAQGYAVNSHTASAKNRPDT
ncbi:MAG TPA: hypothetical protein DCY13_21010 [Verrucomicrobiales bacterium]|jgi:riboflavin biosynthesis pyrimidine reductase|nr:hypothetical protein [Verrucomicrobiales bacterium]